MIAKSRYSCPRASRKPSYLQCTDDSSMGFTNAYTDMYVRHALLALLYIIQTICILYETRTRVEHFQRPRWRRGVTIMNLVKWGTSLSRHHPTATCERATKISKPRSSYSVALVVGERGRSQKTGRAPVYASRAARTDDSLVSRRTGGITDWSGSRFLKSWSESGVEGIGGGGWGCAPETLDATANFNNSLVRWAYMRLGQNLSSLHEHRGPGMVANSVGE